MPIQKSKSKPGIEGSNVLFYGAPGAGKTTSAASFPGTVFLCTEKGIDHYEGITRWESQDGRYVPENWDEFKVALNEVVAANPDWIVVDTVDNAVDLAAKDLLETFKEDSLNSGKLGYGKGLHMLVTRVKDLVRFLVNLPNGLVLTSHVRDVSIEPKVGDQYTRFIPSVQDNREGQVLRAITSQMDLVAFLDHDGASTRLRTNPDRHFEAKNRLGLDLESKPLKFEDLQQMYNYLLSGLSE